MKATRAVVETGKSRRHKSVETSRGNGNDRPLMTMMTMVMTTTYYHDDDERLGKVELFLYQDETSNETEININFRYFGFNETMHIAEHSRTDSFLVAN